MEIAIFDVEGTLTTGSSWRALRGYFKTYNNPWIYHRFFLGWMPRYFLVKLGVVSRRKAMSRWMQEEVRLFQGLNCSEFDRMAEWVVEHEMWPQRRKSVIAELEAYRQEGVKIVLSSSAYQPIVEAFGRKVGADAIGSSLVYVHDKVSGIEIPINAYEEKVAGITRRYEGARILAAYGDSVSDFPMMALSQAPVAVFPKPKLRQEALARGWRIVENE
jgi:HAD superfamily phosphoserine phosphatase-like hydrolase